MIKKINVFLLIFSIIPIVLFFVLNSFGMVILREILFILGQILLCIDAILVIINAIKAKNNLKSLRAGVILLCITVICITMPFAYLVTGLLRGINKGVNDVICGIILIGLLALVVGIIMLIVGLAKKMMRR